MSENSIMAQLQDYYGNKNIKGLRQLPRLFTSKPSYSARGELEIMDFVTALSESGLELPEQQYHVR